MINVTQARSLAQTLAMLANLAALSGKGDADKIEQSQQLAGILMRAADEAAVAGSDTIDLAAALRVLDDIGRAELDAAIGRAAGHP